STLVIEGTDAHGNELQWGRTFLFLANGPRVEVYEEDFVDAALARFEELRPQVRRLENAASQAGDRYSAHFAARDWDALAKVVADDIVTDDRRRVANAGIRHGRDADIANLQATADAGFTYMAPVVIAVRGERLMLARTRVSGGDEGSEEFIADTLGVVEVNSQNQVAAIVVFEVDAFDAAIAELDARYLAGEAAAYARAWSVIAASYVAINRREPPATTAGWGEGEHRREIAMRPGDLAAIFEDGSDPDQEITTYVENVHRLNRDGAVVTYAAQENSREGFHAEWRGGATLTIDGDMVNRTEIFDEEDLDAALARFDELGRPEPRLENTASRANAHLIACANARDWDSAASILADDHYSDDRRRVTGSGTRRGPVADIENFRVVAELGSNI